LEASSSCFSVVIEEGETIIELYSSKSGNLKPSNKGDSASLDSTCISNRHHQAKYRMFHSSHVNFPCTSNRLYSGPYSAPELSLSRRSGISLTISSRCWWFFYASVTSSRLLVLSRIWKARRSHLPQFLQSCKHPWGRSQCSQIRVKVD